MSDSVPPPPSPKRAEDYLPDKPFLRLDEVAEFFGVHPNTVRNWIEAGDLEAGQLPGNDVRILRTSVLALLKKNFPSIS